MTDDEFRLLDYRGRGVRAEGYPLTKMGFLLFLLGNIAWLRFVPRYLRTLSLLRQGGTPFAEGMPWINYGALGWLSGFLKRRGRAGLNVFEYGSGGSSIYFADRGHSLVSVEHDSAWFDLVKARLADYPNVTLLLEKPSALDGVTECKYRSRTFAAYRSSSFERYVRSIEVYPDGYFDLILIDGRCRDRALEISWAKLKKGGCVIFDNSERLHYRAAIEGISAAGRLDYLGFGPFLRSTWRTTVLKK